LNRARRRLKKELDMTQAPKNIALDAGEVNSLTCAARFRGIESNTAIKGLLLDPDGYAIATDGHRLIMRAVPALKQLDSKLVVMPNFSEAAKGEAELSVHLDEVQLGFATDRLAWGIETGKYPDYKKVLPGPARHSVKLAREELINAIAHMEPCLDAAHPELKGYDYLPTVSLSLNSDAARLTLTTTQSLGYVAKDSAAPAPGSLRWQHRVSVPGEFNGFAESFQITLNARFLLDAIESLDTAEITLAFTSSHRSVDAIGGAHRVLTMPMAC
jgi:DNA polymerase III sliding clamp (beta) subunit (PCNA family)